MQCCSVGLMLHQFTLTGDSIYIVFCKCLQLLLYTKKKREVLDIENLLTQNTSGLEKGNEQLNTTHITINN